MALLKSSSSIKYIFMMVLLREDDSVETLRSTIKALEISGENQIKSHILYGFNDLSTARQQICII